MLRLLRKSMRVNAAIAIAMVYALCVLMPAVALGFGGADAVHCLTDQQDIGTKPEHGSHGHGHADSTTHSHSDHEHTSLVPHPEDDGQSHSKNCCGLMCMTALSNYVATFNVTLMQFLLYYPPLETTLTGRVPEGLNRPPNT
jgi:hypothetical protein